MNELLSCDTMVALGNSTKSGNVIFAKNRDRPLGNPSPSACLRLRTTRTRSCYHAPTYPFPR